MENKYCIVRGTNFGVFAGIVKKINGDHVLMENARRIWYWSGAASLSQLATEGVTKPSECKFTVSVPEILLNGVIEIIPCTPKAKSCILGVPEWRV